jgi:glutamate racemase
MPCLHYPLLKERIKKITLPQLSCSDLSFLQQAQTANNNKRREYQRRKAGDETVTNLKQENKPTTKQSQLEARRRAVHLSIIRLVGTTLTLRSNSN